MSSALRSNLTNLIVRSVSIASLIIVILLMLYQNSTILYYYANMPEGTGIQKGIITVGNAGFKQATNVQIEIDPEHKLRIHSVGTYSRGQPVIEHSIQGRSLYEIPQLFQGQSAEFRLSYELNASSGFGESDILVQSNEKRGMAISGLMHLLENVNTIFIIAISTTIFFGMWAIIIGIRNAYGRRRTQN